MTASGRVLYARVGEETFDPQELPAAPVMANTFPPPPPAHQHTHYQGHLNTSAVPVNGRQDPFENVSPHDDGGATPSYYQSHLGGHFTPNTQKKPKILHDASAPLIASSYPDAWASIAFIIASVAFLYLAITSLSSPAARVPTPLTSSFDSLPGTKDPFDMNDGPFLDFPPSHPQSSIPPPFSDHLFSRPADGFLLFGIPILLGFLLSGAFISLVRRHAGNMIVFSTIAAVGFTAIIGILYMFMGAYLAGVIMLVLSGIMGYVYYSIRERFQLAKLLMAFVSDVIMKYPATLILSVATAVISCGVGVLWTMTVIASHRIAKDQEVGHGDAAYGSIMTFLALYLFWFCQVVGNVIHVTISGLFASYYFLGRPDPTAGGSVAIPVVNPTIKSLKRALTTGFGPICFGSLLVSFMQLLRFFTTHVHAHNTTGHRNAALSLIVCCLSATLQVIEIVVRYFNSYAFAQVAIYGMGYIEAGKSTWALFQDRGFDAVINQEIISITMAISCVIVGSFAALIGYIWAVYRFPLWLVVGSGTDAQVGAVVAAHMSIPIFYSVLAASVFAVFIRPFVSGVIAMFVCLAEDPDVLARQQPALFARFQAVYPQVVWGMRSDSTGTSRVDGFVRVSVDVS